MTTTLVLPDDRVRADLATFLGRAARIEGGAVRLQQVGAGVGVWVPVLRPGSILDDAPVVLGLRAIRADVEGVSVADLRDGALDVLVPIRGMLDRLANPRDELRLRIPLPPERLHESWAGISPPRAGWEPVAELSAPALSAAAAAGIAEVARVVPGNLGTLLVEQARTSVWSSPLRVPGSEGTGLVAGVAFAADALGFLAEAPASVSRADGWLRVTTPAGHVLTRPRLDAASARGEAPPADGTGASRD